MAYLWLTDNNAGSIAVVFDDWTKDIPKQEQAIVKNHLKALMGIKNLGPQSAKVLLSVLYVRWLENKREIIL